MTVKNRILRVFRVVTMLFLLPSAQVFAQSNLIVNGDFESYAQYGQITPPSYTDYHRKTGPYIVEAGQYVIDNTTANHAGGVGWPNPSNSHGKYMIVNGWGGPDAPTKIVWKQTVSVTPYTNYTISYRVVNLNRVIMGNSATATIRVKINAGTVGSDNHLQLGNNNWQDWSYQWNSGNNNQAVIEIFDTYTGEEGLGDDFCLDDISFVPDVVYSVTVNNDTWDELACYLTPAEIPVLDNDTISPNQNYTVQVVTQPQHGEANYLSSSHVMEYICFDQSFSGTDSFKYRVGFQAQNIWDEAWVYVTVGQPPTVSNITAPGPICAGGALGIPTPSVSPSAPGQWEYSSSQNGTYQTFDPNNVPLSMNGKYVRYTATNDCGDGSSNAVQITVTNGPSITGQTPQINPICAGTSLNLTPPSISGSPILSQGWVASPTADGEYQSFSLNNISVSYNGWYVRYRVEGNCGFVYSQPARQLTVNVAPSNIGTLEAPESICAGDDLDVTAPTFDGTGTGSWEICQTSGGTYQPFNVNNVPSTYNNWYLHYKVSNNCGNVTSNSVQIHVYEAPTVPTPATPDPICAGYSFNLTVPTIQNNGFTITDQGWQIATSQNGTYNSFNNNNVQYAPNGYWIRYYAVNECGETYSTPIHVTVNDVPLVADITAPAGICEGDALNLTPPQVTWRHNDQSTCWGCWQINLNGTWQDITGNSIPSISNSYNGCSLRYKAHNGCNDSYSNVVTITVYSTQPIVLPDVTFCQAGYYHGVHCTQDGQVYGYDSLTPNNCTIHVSWLFHLSEDYNVHPQTETSCGAYYWPQTGATYDISGVYTDTVPNSNPVECDDVYVLNLTVNHAPEILNAIEAPESVCSGSPLAVTAPQYSMNHVNGGDAHWEYATSANGPFTPFDPSTNNLGYGTYYLRYAVSNECGDVNSNVVVFHVNDVPEANMQLSAIQVCEGELLTLPTVNVNWHNDNENDRVAQWQMSPTQNGTYAPIDPNMPMQLSHSGNWLRFVAQNSCGTDVVGPVMITVISSEDQWLDTITACDVYVDEGVIITETTVVDYEVFEPCYHINHRLIIINHSDNVVEHITSCHDEFEWHGMTFYRSEQTQYASVLFTNIYGCDSVRELQLDFGDYAKITETPQHVCDAYYWPRNQITYEYDENHPHILDSVFIPGNDIVCDSMIYLDLTMGRKWEVEGEPMMECSGFVWHGVPYYADAIVYDSLQTVGTHCDSIIAYQLIIIPSVEKDTSMVSCQPVWWNGHYFENDGDVYQHTYTSQYGCDSIVTMHFSLSDEIVNPIDHYACEPFNWYGVYCEQDGQTYSHTFTTQQGCDSTVLLTLHLLNQPLIVNTPDVYACDSYVLNGVTYGAGVYEVYHDTVYSTSGHCDSLVYHTRIEVGNSEQVGQILGSSNVYVASNLISGIYRYEINPEDVQGEVTWTLSNPDWQIVEAVENYCRIFVATPGMAVLTARFDSGECGEMERTFEIFAGFFGLDDHQVLDVKIFPNPTRGTVNIEAEGIERVRIVDMMGQTLEKHEIGRQDQTVLNMGAYAPSVYLLEIETVNGKAMRRVVICR